MRVESQPEPSLEQIRHGDHQVIKDLYKTAYHYCSGYVLRNKGTQEEYKDIFQEALIIFINKAQAPDFTLNCKPKVFLYSIIRFLWLREIEKKRKSNVHLIIDEPEKEFVLIEQNDIEEKIELEKKYEQLYNCMDLLKEECRKLLKMTFFLKMKDKEVGPILGYTSDFVRQKRRRCMNYLKKLLFA